MYGFFIYYCTNVVKIQLNEMLVFLNYFAFQVLLPTKRTLSCFMIFNLIG